MLQCWRLVFDLFISIFIWWGRKHETKTSIICCQMLYPHLQPLLSFSLLPWNKVIVQWLHLWLQGAEEHSHSPCWRIWRRGSCAVIGWRRCSGQRADCQGRSEHPPRGSGNRSALTPPGRSSLGKANSAAKWGVSLCFQHSDSQSDACFACKKQSQISWTRSHLNRLKYSHFQA